MDASTVRLRDELGEDLVGRTILLFPTADVFREIDPAPRYRWEMIKVDTPGTVVEETKSRLVDGRYEAGAVIWQDDTGARFRADLREVAVVFSTDGRRHCRGASRRIRPGGPPELRLCADR